MRALVGCGGLGTEDVLQPVVTVVPGFGEPLVSGETVGEEWTLTIAHADITRAMPTGAAAGSCS